MSQSNQNTSIIDLLHQGNKTTFILAQILQKGLECGQLNLQDDRTLALLQTVAQNPLQLYSSLSLQQDIPPPNECIGHDSSIPSNLRRHVAASSVHIPGIGAETRAVSDMSLRQQLLGIAEGKYVSCSRHIDGENTMVETSCSSTASMSTMTMSLNEAGTGQRQEWSPTNKRSVSARNEGYLLSTEEERSKRVREMDGFVLSSILDIEKYISSKHGNQQAESTPKPVPTTTHGESKIHNHLQVKYLARIIMFLLYNHYSL